MAKIKLNEDEELNYGVEEIEEEFGDMIDTKTINSVKDKMKKGKNKNPKKFKKDKYYEN